MAFKIGSTCMNCGFCTAECPNSAILQEGEKHIINSNFCTECVGFFDEAQCRKVCPIACIQLDPTYQETQEALQAKHIRLQKEKV